MYIQKYPQGEMGIRNKLTVGVHMKELDNFKKFCALLTLQNRFNVSVILSTAHKMNYGGIGTQTFLTNISRISLVVLRILPKLVGFRRRQKC